MKKWTRTGDGDIKHYLEMWSVAFGALLILNAISMLVFDNAITDLQVIASSVLFLVCKFATKLCK